MIFTKAFDVEIFPNVFSVTFIDLLDYLKKEYLDLLIKRYGIELSDNENILLQIAKKRGLLENGKPSTLKASKLLLNEFKNGIIGQISLEKETKCL